MLMVMSSLSYTSFKVLVGYARLTLPAGHTRDLIIQPELSLMPWSFSLLAAI